MKKNLFCGKTTKNCIYSIYQQSSREENIKIKKLYQIMILDPLKVKCTQLLTFLQVLDVSMIVFNCDAYKCICRFMNLHELFVSAAISLGLMYHPKGKINS